MKKKILFTIIIIFLSFIKGDYLSAQTNKYQLYGEELLDELNDKYYNSTSELYVESINSSTLVKSTTSFIWPAAHMLNALVWGTLVNPKYKTRLESYTNKISWYKNGEGYGCTKGGQRFFDDNGIIGYSLMQVYEKHIHTPAVLNNSLYALNYCLKYKDVNWGLPQTEPDLNKGIFYVGPVNPLSGAYAILYNITKDSSYLDIAKKYYDALNDYTKKIKSSTTLLFTSGSTYANGVWTASSQGPRASNTGGVVVLGIKLYAITGDVRYLNEARAMTDAMLKKWYKPGLGFSEISMWGGSSMVVVLCDMYNIDPNPKWYNAAKDILDFLIDHARDKNGFYPTGSDAANGNWNLNRTTADSPETITMMSQACAATAILRFAYLDLNKDVSAIPNVPNAATNLVIYPSPVTDVLNILSTQSDINVEIYSLLGQKVIQSKDKEVDVSGLASGVYSVLMKSDGRVYKNKFIKR